MHPWEQSSDDEPLVPGAVRNVAPRLMGFESVGVTQIDQESSGTVPPTPGALVEVGRAPLDQVGDAETMEDMLDALAVDEVDDGARSLDEGEKYRELLEGYRCHLVVVGVETGARWSQEAYEFVNSMRDAPPILRLSALWRGNADG